MKKMHLALALCVLLSLALPPAALAQDDGNPNTRDPAEEQEIYDRLNAINPNAVPIFQRATNSLDTGDFASAREDFLLVLDMAPNFSDALRRLSYVEVQLGDTSKGVEYARAALEADSSPYNKAALAAALLTVDTTASQQEALRLARDAASILPNDDYTAYCLAVAGLYNNDLDALRQGTETLLRFDPKAPEAHFFAGFVAASDNRWLAAEQEMLLAKELGMPADIVDQALNKGGISGQARTARWFIRGGIASAVWLVGLGVLFVIGAMLSTLTLSTIKHLPTSTSYAISPTERLTRGLYRIVVALASGYFFLSIPFLIFLVVGIAGGVIYFFLAVGRIPLNIVGVVGISALYTLFAIIRSVFTRVRQADPGPCLPREEAPQLWTLLEEVASRVGTRPVDTVFVTPFPEIAVTERGGLLKKFTGTGERVLILGLGALPDMTQAQFRAVLAHEYGHFSNRDTAGGGLALQVRASMRNMAYSLAVNHQTHYLNPVWLFLMGYDRVFLRITLGASRLQEILADRQAALAYGARNMIDALTHIVRQSIRFSMQASLELEDALRQRRNPQNLYTLPPIQEETLLKGLNEKFREEMYRATTPYDSHPSIKDRFDLLGEFESSPPSARDDKMVWDLIPRVQELQSSMSHALFKKATLKMSSL